MNVKTIAGLSIIVGVLLTGCSQKNDFLRDQIGSYRNYIDVQGSIDNEIYTYPNNLFQYKVPSLLKPGARIKDNQNGEYSGGISFSDDIGKLIRVEFINKYALKGNNDRDTLEKSSAFIYNTMYKPTGMDIRLIHEEYIDNKLYAIFDFPNGSTMHRNGKPMNAVRGSVFFIKNNNLFVITRQSTEGIFMRTKYKYNDIPQMIEMLQSDLKDFK